MTDPVSSGPPHRRRPRYSGKYPRRFDEKYKERDPARYAATVSKVLASGKTPAGMHRPIMVAEVLEWLNPQPGQVMVDATLGYGGHAAALLPRLLPGGRLIGLDADPLELPKTTERLRGLGFDASALTVVRSNFAGLPQCLAANGIAGVDGVLADLGVSSMQLDNPDRGFSIKSDGPLDMRMNPGRGQSASEWLQRVSVEELARVLAANADEPQAERLARELAGRAFATPQELSRHLWRLMAGRSEDDVGATLRRVFQAVRIAVNEEFSALETLLRHLPLCLNPGGMAVILTFHSGEDRRVKKAFESGLASGLYADVAQEVVRPSQEERRENPRSTPAKLRWARRAQERLGS